MSEPKITARPFKHGVEICHGVSVTFMCTATPAIAAEVARRINHAEKLAEACEGLLDKICHHYPNDWHGTKASAIAALAAYREGKGEAK